MSERKLSPLAEQVRALLTDAALDKDGIDAIVHMISAEEKFRDQTPEDLARLIAERRARAAARGKDFGTMGSWSDIADGPGE